MGLSISRKRKQTPSLPIKKYTAVPTLYALFIRKNYFNVKHKIEKELHISEVDIDSADVNQLKNESTKKRIKLLTSQQLRSIWSNLTAEEKGKYAIMRDEISRKLVAQGKQAAGSSKQTKPKPRNSVAAYRPMKRKKTDTAKARKPPHLKKRAKVFSIKENKISMEFIVTLQLQGQAFTHHQMVPSKIFN